MRGRLHPAFRFGAAQLASVAAPGGGGGAVPSIVNATTASHTGSSGTIAVPSGSGGVFIIVAGDFQAGTSNNITATGFTAAPFNNQFSDAGSAELRLYVFHRTADGSEGANFTLNYSSAFYADVVCFRVSGADAADLFGDDFSVAQGDFGSATRLMGELDSEVNNSLLIAASFGWDHSMAAALTGMTQVANWNGTSSAYLFRQDIAAAGNIAQKSASTSAGDAWHTLGFTIRPA